MDTHTHITDARGEVDDAELLRRYRAGDDGAFAAIVRRHADWVYSVARRHVGGDHHLADDVAQATFMVLARKARSPRKGEAPPLLLGPWLFKVVRYTAMAALRGEARRRAHERKAASMTAEAKGGDVVLEHFEPSAELDEAVERLRGPYRRAILLRFYHRKDFAEVARELNVSQPAARKRVERAVERLRAILVRRRGGTGAGAGAAGPVASAILAHSLWSSNVQAAPAQAVAAWAAAATASAATSAGAAGAAGELANQVVARIARESRARTALAAVATVLLALLLVSGAAAIALRSDDGSSSTTPRGGETSRSGGDDGDARPLKVGILVSHATATIPKELHAPLASPYPRQSVAKLRDPSIELYAILEPETANVPAVARFVAESFEPGRVVDGGDARSLGQLDVIVTPVACRIPPPVLRAMREAVAGGVGYVRGCPLDHVTSTPDESRDALLGMINARYFWRPDRTLCDVVAPDHPILRGLPLAAAAGEAPAKMPIGGSNGYIGVSTPGVVPLIAATGAGNRYSGVPGRIYSEVDLDTHGQTFYPLYVTQLGRGRIVACQWNRAPVPLDKATNGKFFIRCVRWAAGRDVE